MKKIYIILLLPFMLYAKSFLISSIPLPETSIQNLDPYSCDEECLEDYLNKGLIFSFLAHADYPLNSENLQNIKKKEFLTLNINTIASNTKIKIALLLPYKKIGRYSSSTTNAAFAYLMSNNVPFELKTYKIENENYKDIKEALEKIKHDKFNYVIAPLTFLGEKIVSKINPNLNIYFPTINKKDSNTNSSYLYYGGIDYRAQSNLLLKETTSPLVIFYDKSSIGKKLSLYQQKQYMEMDNNLSKEGKTVIKFIIPRRTTNLKRQLKENKKITEGSFFVNTPIIKSSMIISQLTLYDTNATNILSTQTNYNPLLLSMTQYQDRKNMIIANSITHHEDVIIETNALLGNDIVYDWINYTTTVGIDYFFNKIMKNTRKYNIDIVNNQMQYPIELIKPSVSRFIPYIN